MTIAQFDLVFNAGMGWGLVLATTDCLALVRFRHQVYHDDRPGWIHGHYVWKGHLTIGDLKR